MPAAAADAPVGSHQGCQMKKYVLTKVINQITARRARPIYHDLQRSIFRTPQRKKNEILRMAGKSITGRCDKRKSEGGCARKRRSFEPMIPRPTQNDRF